MDCGTISSVQLSCDTFEPKIENTFVPQNVKFSRLNKIKDWNIYTNEEKCNYKLKKHVQELCNTLKIPETLIESIIPTVIDVINSIKEYDGTKRSRVKDGIIIICIYYISKDTPNVFYYKDLAKKINLDIKYITKAEKIVLELLNSKKIHIDKSVILDTLEQFNYIINYIQKYNIKIDNHILDETKLLVDICKENDILDNTPLSIGVACFYYILKKYNLDINIKTMSELYNVSSITIIKTYNKLNTFKKQIDKLLKKV